MYALVDINGAFVSMEYVFLPGARNEAGVVLSNGDGCIIAANRIAKDLPGFEMYSPEFQMREILDRYKVRRFSPNFELYVDMSRRFISELQYFSDRVEMYSIDEAFLDLYFTIIDYKEYGHTIRKAILKNLDLPVGVGIAATKTLCKVASKIAKKFIHLTDGVHVIDTEERRIKALKWLPIEDVWGIGRQFAKKLISMGIKKAYDFTLLPDNWIRKYMSVVGLRLKEELLGIACNDITEILEVKKEIGTATAFGNLMTDYELIKEALCTKTDYLAGKLRRQESVASAIRVFLQTNSFSYNDEQYSNGIAVTLDVASSDTNYLIRNAISGLDRIFKPNLRYKRVGVSLIGLFPDNCVQQNLFVNVNQNHTAIQKVVDKLNMKYEQGTVKMASCGYNRSVWDTKAAIRSPRYTTRIREVLNLGKDVLSFKQ